MRLLFPFAGSEGHLQPMLPLARTAAAAGQAVTKTLTADDVLAAVSAVLTVPGYRGGAARVHAEIAASPRVADALALLEQLESGAG